jgi:hypothetical protein
MQHRIVGSGKPGVVLVELIAQNQTNGLAAGHGAFHAAEPRYLR